MVYIASPYTQGSTARNVRNQIIAANVLRAKGYLPFVPLLSHFWHLVSPHPYEYWMEMDREWVARCDAVLRLPGDSAGADEEVAVARSLGKPVYYSVYELEEAG